MNHSVRVVQDKDNVRHAMSANGFLVVNHVVRFGVAFCATPAKDMIELSEAETVTCIECLYWVMHR